MTLAPVGSALGNFNDRHSHYDSRSEASLRWRLIDRFAGWLYTH